ncbi:avidin-related protein 4/5-like [Camarhynchus parvulus]|uniref:avidin-related protein 4/5-like n=1 Tax=Geospiza parvula TaxID=87175 RepID=UPI001237F286|nr:avidin-related protein 4/5-like [Camarhynchus parvulus]
MVQASPLLLALFLALGAHGLAVKKCNLTGQWWNDLGSNMTIDEVKKNGDFTGKYLTAVSGSTSNITASPMVGSQQLANLSQPTFGFTVHWSFTDSITVFTGQCFVDEYGKEVLKTMWLLRSRVENIKNDWKATRVGYNTFGRNKTSWIEDW